MGVEHILYIYIYVHTYVDIECNFFYCHRIKNLEVSSIASNDEKKETIAKAVLSTSVDINGSGRRQKFRIIFGQTASDRGKPTLFHFRNTMTCVFCTRLSTNSTSRRRKLSL